MSEISGIARMNIAACDDATLDHLCGFFLTVEKMGTNEGRASAPAFLAAIKEEQERRADNKTLCQAERTKRDE